MQEIINEINENRKNKFIQISTTNSEMEDLNTKLGKIAIRADNRLVFSVERPDGYVTSTIKDITIINDIYTVTTRNSIYTYKKMSDV